MPFTLSHPAAVLPFRRFCPRYLEFAALVIGSLTPDLGYYVRRFEIASFAHTIFGSFIVCLPSGVLMFLIFYLVRKPICFILPAPHREPLLLRCTGVLPVSLRRATIVALSLLLGAWSHILWDSFTHLTGWFVQRFSWFRAPVFIVGSTQFQAYYVLQQLSTVVGGAILIVAYFAWLRRQQPAQPAHPATERWRYLLCLAIAAFALLLSLPVAAHDASRFQGYLAFRVFVFRAAVYFISIAVPLVILAAPIVYARRSRAALP